MIQTFAVFQKFLSIPLKMISCSKHFSTLSVTKVRSCQVSQTLKLCIILLLNLPFKWILKALPYLLLLTLYLPGSIFYRIKGAYNNFTRTDWPQWLYFAYENLMCWCCRTEGIAYDQTGGLSKVGSVWPKAFHLQPGWRVVIQNIYYEIPELTGFVLKSQVEIQSIYYIIHLINLEYIVIWASNWLLFLLVQLNYLPNANIKFIKE